MKIYIKFTLTLQNFSSFNNNYNGKINYKFKKFNSIQFDPIVDFQLYSTDFE